MRHIPFAAVHEDGELPPDGHLGEEVESVAPCRPQRAGQWEKCDTPVARTMVNPEWIANLKPHLRDSFLASCATDSKGNAWIPKWCVAHTRETFNKPSEVLDLFNGVKREPE